MTALESTFHLRVIAARDSSVRVTGRPPEWKTGETDGIRRRRKPAREEEDEEEESRKRKRRPYRGKCGEEEGREGEKAGRKLTSHEETTQRRVIRSQVGERRDVREKRTKEGTGGTEREREKAREVL